MNRVERVALITSIAGLLADREWDEIDFILRQFGFPTSDNWHSGDRHGYVLHHLGDGEDGDLLELRDYVDGGAQEDARDSARLWKPGSLRLFMSHVSDEKQLVAAVKQELARHGIDCFVAHEDIEPTREWVSEIDLALSSCDALVAFLTDGFHKSSWTDQEVGYCVARRLLIVPVRLGLDPYGFIGRYQALSPPSSDPPVLAAAIAKVLRSNDLTRSKVGPALIRRFEEADSFAEAKALMSEVEELDAWTPEMLRALEHSITRNSQISGAWGVPERIRAVIGRHSQ